MKLHMLFFNSYYAREGEDADYRIDSEGFITMAFKVRKGEMIDLYTIEDGRFTELEKMICVADQPAGEPLELEVEDTIQLVPVVIQGAPSLD